jgi:hypothetical protein
MEVHCSIYQMQKVSAQACGGAEKWMQQQTQSHQLLGNSPRHAALHCTTTMILMMMSGPPQQKMLHLKLDDEEYVHKCRGCK